MQSPQLEPVQKQVLKVAVLSEPYFPLQKLVIRFSQTILQQMEINDNSDG
jgi:endopeptidase La